MKRRITSGRLTGTRASGVRPTFSAASTPISIDSGEPGPCSQSKSTQSNPARPAYSTMAGWTNIVEQPTTALPLRSFALVLFVLSI